MIATRAMNNLLHYRGFTSFIEVDAEDGGISGKIADISDVVGFHANEADGIFTAFEEAVDDYIESCARIGKQPGNVD